MNKLATFAGVFSNEVYKFYNDLDTPEWRFTDSPCVHTAYKVTAATAFSFVGLVYCGWKSLTSV